jgi:hypothetical protein
MSGTDDKVGSAYRSLGREEPPSALDSRILAASRDALARPSASRRWAAPVSIAAVLVLAFGVTLHMQREQPGVESPDMDATRPAERKLEAIAPAAPPAPAPAAEPTAPTREQSAAPPRREIAAKRKALPEAKPDKVEAESRARDEKRPLQGERKDLDERAARSSLAKESSVGTGQARDSNVAAEPAVAAAAAPPQPKLQAAPAPQFSTQASTVPPPAAPAAVARMKREAAPAQAPAGALADAQAVDEPARELEAIAKLRVEGRHEEADKALAEFRRKRPDYRIADAMWERVKPR